MIRKVLFIIALSFIFSGTVLASTQPLESLFDEQIKVYFLDLFKEYTPELSERNRNIYFDYYRNLFINVDHKYVDSNYLEFYKNSLIFEVKKLLAGDIQAVELDPRPLNPQDPRFININQDVLTKKERERVINNINFFFDNISSYMFTLLKSKEEIKISAFSENTKKFFGLFENQVLPQFDLQRFDIGYGEKDTLLKEQLSCDILHTFIKYKTEYILMKTRSEYLLCANSIFYNSFFSPKDDNQLAAICQKTKEYLYQQVNGKSFVFDYDSLIILINDLASLLDNRNLELRAYKPLPSYIYTFINPSYIKE